MTIPRLTPRHAAYLAQEAAEAAYARWQATGEGDGAAIRATVSTARAAFIRHTIEDRKCAVGR